MCVSVYVRALKNLKVISFKDSGTYRKIIEQRVRAL